MTTKYNFFENEEKIRHFWESHFIYEVNISEKKPLFIIDTPPPTISGNLHIGHVFSYTQQDIIARFKRMNGFTVIYPFGFDDNGLPTERYIEKEKNISSHKYSRPDFVAICLEEIKKAHQIYINLWKRIGFSVDWNLIYSTISPETQAISQKSFIDLYNKGYVYKKHEPALYCTAYKTSVSQADLEEKEKETVMSQITFFEKETREKIVIATTRPELLSGCVAVLVHPEDQRYLNLIGKIAIVPFYNIEVPIIADDMVIPEKGTGIVMSATFGDALDVAWFKKYNFEYKKVINLDGTLSDVSTFLSGMKVEAARAYILDKLEKEGYLISQEKITHRVSIYERSKKEIEYVMLSQWFVSLLPFKEEFLAIADTINWFPHYMKYRYRDWVENLSWDWCISRQRFFGIPFPVWYDKNNTIIVADIKNLPVDPLIDLPEGFSKDEIIPDTDVMDTWNTSSLTPYLIQGMLKKKGLDIKIPLVMRPQAHDIIRTWAFDTIVKSYLHDGAIPWKDIVISGHVLSNDNQKISKSKGNSPLDPENLLKQYPADVIRYWTAGAKLGIDTAFSETQFKDGNRLLIKLCNAAICLKDFAIFNSKNNPFIEQSDTVILEPVNRWIVSKMNSVYSEYQKNFAEYDYNGSLKSVEKFFWLFCDNYLEMTKVYSQNQELFSVSAVNETKLISGIVFLEILKLFSPFIPHMTEYIFQEYYSKEESIHVTQFFEFPLYKEPEFDSVIAVIEKIRKHKTEKKLSLKSKIDFCQIYIENEMLYEYMLKNSLLISIISVVEKIVISQKNAVENDDYSKLLIHDLNLCITLSEDC